MRKSVVFAALAGLSVTVTGLGIQHPDAAFATTLDGFAISTQDKAVTVTLFTDQRAQYTTETQGKQFAIILPGTQLSQEQMNNGLPVVIDNKNRFIGRAVPTEDGKVKIILPNLPANEYSVSIQQKRPGQAAEPAPVSLAKPHAVVNPKNDNHFEKVAESFPKPVVIPSNSLGQNTDSNSIVRLSSAPLSAGSAASAPVKATSGSVWNPYVVRVPSLPQIASSPYSSYRPVINPPRHAVRRPAPQPADEPVNIVSVADSSNGSFNNPTFDPAPAHSPGLNQASDPLWYLHALPPAAPGQIPLDNLKGLAQENPFAPTNLLATTPAPQPAPLAPPAKSPFADLKDAVMALPRWLLMTAAVFLGGMGLFTMIGGLVLLRILFSQAKHGFSGMPQPTFVFPPGYQFTPVDANGQPILPTGKSPYASQPEPASRPAFQDTAAVNALDYLKNTPADINQAVHDAVLVKFPNRQRQRTSGIKRPQRRTGTEAAVGYKP